MYYNLKTPKDIAQEIWDEGAGFPTGFGPAMIDLLAAAAEAAFEVSRVVSNEEVEAGAWALLDRGMDIVDRPPGKHILNEAKADARAVLNAAREVRVDISD